MLSFLKKLFGGGPGEPAAPAPPPSPAPPKPALAAAPAPPAAGPDKPAAPASAATPTAAPAQAPATPTPAPTESLSLPLKNIIEQLPAELKPSIATPPAGDVTVAVPLKTVLEGLPRGAVKMSFGELRRTAPAGVFTTASSNDQTVIQLPLKDILARVKPEHLAARPQQKTIEVPDDIKPVFGTGGKAPPAPAPAAAPAPTPAPVAPPSAPTPVAPAVAAPAPPAAPKAPTPATPMPTAPLKPSTPLPAPATAAPPAPRPAPAAPKPAPAPAPAAPAPAPAGSVGKVEGDKLALPFGAVLPGLPEPLKAELASLGQSTLSLKLDELEPMMKKGRVSFPWKRLRALIQPAPAATLGAAQDDAAVDIPLKLLIPHFMAARKPAPAQKQVSVDENIPDVFAGRAAAPAAPAPSAPVPTPPAPAPVAAPTPAAAAPAPALPASKLGQLFGQPSKATWAPAEIVHATVKLGGIAGALIATHDGLGVASQLPPSLNAEAMSGFLPEIFNRINQYTKDLKLGETSAITVRVGQQPLEIRRAGKVFFAALGLPGQSLPAEKLSAIATELEQQHQ